MLKCDWCSEEIIESPYVTKRWLGIDEEENYHSHCFVIAHQGLLDNVPKRALEKLNKWKEQITANLNDMERIE